MKRIWLTQFYIVLITVLMFYQNCAPIHEGASNDDSLNGANKQNSIQIFESTLFPLVQNNCTSCHGSSQPPLFAENDAAKSHDAIINFSLVDLDNPANSRLVTKIASGHQGFNQTLADEFQAAIADWADELAKSGTTNPTNNVTLEATFQSIHQLILVPKCVSCHNPNGVRRSEDYSDYNSTINTGKVVAGNANASEMYTECTNGSMPENAPALSAEELSVMREWINDGALNN